MFVPEKVKVGVQMTLAIGRQQQTRISAFTETSIPNQ